MDTANGYITEQNSRTISPLQRAFSLQCFPRCIVSRRSPRISPDGDHFIENGLSYDSHQRSFFVPIGRHGRRMSPNYATSSVASSFNKNSLVSGLNISNAIHADDDERQARDKQFALHRNRSASSMNNRNINHLRTNSAGPTTCPYDIINLVGLDMNSWGLVRTATYEIEATSFVSMCSVP